MPAQAMAQHHIEGGQAAEQQNCRQPEAKGDQQRPHGQQGNPVLQQAAQALEQGQGPVARFTTCPVEVIVELGQFVKRQVGGNRLVVNQAADMVCEQLPLHGADPAASAAQQLRQQQDSGQQDRQNHQRPDALPAAPGLDRRHQAIDQQFCQVNRGRRQQTLQNKQTQPKSCPIPGRIPDQSQCPGQMGQFGYQTP